MGTRYVVGVDVGGTNIRIGAVDEYGNLHNEKRYSSQESSGQTAVQNLQEELRHYLQSLNGSTSAVCIGFPATMNKERTAILNSPNLKGFDGTEIQPLYQKELGLPVFADKDAVMLLMYDMCANKIPNSGIVAGIYIGTGIGNSIMINGRPVLGKDGAACELGHIPVPGRVDPCTCGLKGCFELYAGGKGLENICEKYFPQTPISAVFAVHKNAAQLNTFLDNVACAVATEVNLLNPNHMILGGGVLAMDGFPKDLLLEKIRTRVRKPLPANTLSIVFSKNNSPFNGVIGAGLLGFEKLKGEKI